MWGAWWVWDARLTSELILLFLYLGYMALLSAFEDRRTGARAGAILALVGVINIPIIHYSVEWWNTLHQGPTVTKFDKPSIHISMLIPLLLMAVAFKKRPNSSKTSRSIPAKGLPPPSKIVPEIVPPWSRSKSMLSVAEPAITGMLVAPDLVNFPS